VKPAIVRFDTSLTSAIQSLPHINAFMNGVTLLGSPILIITIGFLGIGYGLVKDVRYLTTAFSWTMIVYLLGWFLKEFIHRTRPDTVYVTAMKFKSYSFPSAHALGSILIFGIFAYLGYKHLASPWNIIAPLFLGMIVFLIGISRVYLGAHYPSDVIGGWILGGLSLFLIIHFCLK
jgi:undecaprenyl-diphosphatase